MFRREWRRGVWLISRGGQREVISRQRVASREGESGGGGGGGGWLVRFEGERREREVISRERAVSLGEGVCFDREIVSCQRDCLREGDVVLRETGRGGEGGGVRREVGVCERHFQIQSS